MQTATDAIEIEIDEATETAMTLIRTLFEPGDAISFRIFETWTEGGAKKSRVDFRRSGCLRAEKGLNRRLRRLVEATFTDGTNVSFGACPREGEKGFELAWQIRTVRTLWADVDDATPEATLARVEKAGLPRPTATVSSGNGTHLYWLLETPFRIDDAAPPPQVLKEKIEKDGKVRYESYYLEEGEKVWLDKRRPKLSPKAHKLQNVVAGVAAAIGGDNVHDLARMMRLPGLPNRKEHRNGQAPKPTRIVECDPQRKYPLEAFERFAKETSEAKRDREIGLVKLPATRKPSARKQDVLNEKIAVCGLTPSGERSERDFALCCYAIAQGIDREEVWRQVEQVGKFAESGRKYFDRTWDGAADRVRERRYEEIVRKQRLSPARKEGDVPETEEEAEAKERRADKTIIELAGRKVTEIFDDVTKALLNSRYCYTRLGAPVRVVDDELVSIDSATRLAGVLTQLVEFGTGRPDDFTTFPPSYGGPYLANSEQLARLPKIALFTHNPVYSKDWRLLPPGFDSSSGIYYSGPKVEPREGTERLDALIGDFCFRSPCDRTNYLGILVTCLLMPRFVGSKPGVIFNGNKPGLGKTLLAQIISILRDGRAAATLSFSPDDAEMEKRLGTAVRSGATTLIIDNARTSRKCVIQSAVLERSLTDEILSYRLLGSNSLIQSENSHIFCITANAPDVSQDLVTRCVAVNLSFEGDPLDRRYRLRDPLDYATKHRVEILGELAGMIERWKAVGMPRSKARSRFNRAEWGEIVGGVLDAANEPDFLINAEEAALEMDHTRREFGALVEEMAKEQQEAFLAKHIVRLAAKHSLLHDELGEGEERGRSTNFGRLAGRYLGVSMKLSDGRVAVLRRKTSNQGTIYSVETAGK